MLSSADPGSAVSYTPGVYYRGILADRPNSVVTLSFFEHELMGIISGPDGGNLVLGRLENAGGPLAYVLYDDLNLPVSSNFECKERSTDGNGHIPGHPDQPEVAGCVEIYFECDYELFQNKGSVLATVNYVTGLFNQVATLYTNEAVTVTISQIYVWTTPDNYTNTSSSTALDEFMALRTNFSGDLAHLLSLGGQGTGGIAYLDVLCVPSFAYGYSNIDDTYSNVPTYSWSIEVVTHELGHNLGSHHTQWCGWPGGAIDNCYTPEGTCSQGPPPTNGGTIMSYCHLTSNGINFNNGFGPLPQGAIQAGVTTAQSGGCISTSCTAYSCNPPTDISIGSITTSSAVVSWGSVGGATSYNLQYRVVGTGAWTTSTNVTSPHTVNGLLDGTFYELQMQAICGGAASRYGVGVIFKTQYNSCTVPSNLTTTSNTSNSSTINWTENGTSTSWQVEYGARGFTLGSGTQVSVSSKPTTISGLSPSLGYDFYVRANCGGGTYSNWAGPGIMTTALDNNAPASAVLLTVDAPCPGQNCYRNNEATVDGLEPNPKALQGIWGKDADKTVWFKFVAPASGTIMVTTDLAPQGSMNDAQIALYRVGTVGMFSTYTLLASHEDGGTVGSTYCPFLYYTGLTPGDTYYVQVDSWSPSSGYFCIEVKDLLAIGNPGTGCINYTETVNNPNIYYNFYTKPVQYSLGLPVAALKASNNLGTVTLSATRSSSVQQSTSGVYYMQRYVNFNSSLSGSSGTKNVRLLYTQNELSNLQAASGNAGTIDDLNITHYDGSNEDCQLSNNSNGTYTLISAVNATNIANSGTFYLDFQVPGFSEMGAHFGSTPLPVELTRFEGRVLAGANQLLWTTASESGLTQFVLERSENGLNNWKAIGQQPASNASDGHAYSFDDPLPVPPAAYYRLRMTELDGSFRYSQVILLERKDTKSGIITLYPNPAQREITVQYQSNQEEEISGNCSTPAAVYWPPEKVGW
ncbi:MAG: fibronectin type III domain-containing protein [Lewinellaceae bacterium]|nr:fibronectin type III domain-containing protein [Lewinellaceae bacterium]